MGYFTTEQLEEIKQYILDTGTKDTDLPSVSNVSSKDEIVIVQNGYNKKINLRTLFSSFGGITKDLETVEKNTNTVVTNFEDIKLNMITNENLAEKMIGKFSINDNGKWVVNDVIIGQATGDKGDRGDNGGIYKPTLINNNIQYEYTESMEDFNFNFNLNSLTQSNEVILDSVIYVKDLPSKCFISGVNTVTYIVGGTPTINIVYDGTSKESFIQVKETTNLKFVDESDSSYMIVYKDEDGNYTETFNNINLNPSYIYKIIIQNGISSGIACYNGWGMSVEVVEQSCRQ